MPSGKPYPPEIKARAMAALAAGNAVSYIAGQTGIPIPTLRTWRQSLRRENIINDTEKKDELGELVYAYLREAIETLQAQARFARDADWLRSQSANDLAILHGVIHDKTVRLLAALTPAESDPAV